MKLIFLCIELNIILGSDIDLYTQLSPFACGAKKNKKPVAIKVRPIGSLKSGSHAKVLVK